MSDTNDIYNVEKILRRKLIDGKTNFLIKWEGYDRSKSTWEPEENLVGCEELLENYLHAQAHECLNTRKNGNTLEYLIRQKDGMPDETAPSVEVFAQWPAMVLDYLQKHINIVRDANSDGLVPNEATHGVIGDPIRITYVTNVYGRLVYWCQWANGGQFIEADEAVSQWPRLVKDFLEQRLTFGVPSGVNGQVGGKRKKANDCEPDFYVGDQMVSRAKARKLNPTGFEESGLVKVVRRVAFDKALLLKKSSNVTRRRTIGLQRTPARPILARGRKSMAPRVTFAPLPPPRSPPTPASPATPSTPSTSITRSNFGSSSPAPALASPSPSTPTTSSMTRFNYGSSTPAPALASSSPSTPTTKMMIQPKQN